MNKNKKSQKKIIEQIEKRTLEAGKTYAFRDKHNPRLPADYWFQNSTEGRVFFLVLYTQACRWAQCLGCNLPSQVSKEHIGYKDIIKQIEFVFHNVLSKETKQSLRKIILSNNGSVLDEVTLSTTALLYFVVKMNLHCPNIAVLTLETRPEYVDLEELELLARALAEGDTPTRLELAVGFEAFDEKIRNVHFKKGFNLETFEKLAQEAGSYGFFLKTYFMLKPIPGLSEEEAVQDIQAAIDYLEEISRQSKVGINLHLNPTYVARGTGLETAFHAGRFVPPRLESVRRAILHGQGKQITIFAGLYDEGLAVPGGSFIRKGDEALVEKIEQFNRTQDYKLLM